MHVSTIATAATAKISRHFRAEGFGSRGHLAELSKHFNSDYRSSLSCNTRARRRGSSSGGGL